MIDSGNEGDRQRRVLELGRSEALRLLASAPMGRVVYTRDALPAIRPVNHLVDEDGLIVVRTRLHSTLTGLASHTSPVVVTYGADEIDPVRRIGWSVSVTGLARTVSDPRRIESYERRLRPWVEGAMDAVITIDPDIVTGIRLLEREAGAIGDDLIDRPVPGRS
ncbi:pyridoxamine 5'-phosphate oxidase [Nocardia mangyaensis]|uniref:Pyridoxamine 5'-phosphate oxidase n=1 Tax=Nocardia mangyaensis TaxID=2213200 RepID=A0A1J0VS78_9NOCA|nr:pyridoxamine 5'-phosphate oxidase family protein [Nocardia mangyaensis]APE34866.1 pyridoxamine 5'-phosphate oxidase [Nocardia mangyaensis]